MKCINCQTDNNLQDRTGNQGRCKICDHPFAFEPTAMGNVKLTDGFFQKVIAELSVNNTLFFSYKQLLYFLDKRLKLKNLFAFPLPAIFSLIIIVNVFFTVFLGLILSSVFNSIAGYGFATSVGFWLTIFSLTSILKSKNLSNLDKKNPAKALIILGIIILLIGILSSVTIYQSFVLFIISVLLGMWSIYLGTTAQQSLKNATDKFLVSRTQTEEWLQRWQQINGEISFILPALPTASTSNPVNPEITNYSFDRVVVTDTASVAQFLIANNFHFENNCAVLSITGYPREIFETILEMLKRNNELQVYALHDATPRGVSLVYNLKSNKHWFADSSATIYDLGILPRQVLKKAKISVLNSSDFAQEARRLPSQVKENLSPEEIAWLELGNYVELESFTPQRLLQFVTKGIALSRSNDDSDILVPMDSYSSDVGYIYAVDSFG